MDRPYSYFLDHLYSILPGTRRKDDDEHYEDIQIFEYRQDYIEEPRHAMGSDDGNNEFRGRRRYPLHFQAFSIALMSLLVLSIPANTQSTEVAGTLLTVAPQNLYSVESQK